jgi:hypothetical protein
VERQLKVSFNVCKRFSECCNVVLSRWDVPCDAMDLSVNLTYVVSQQIFCFFLEKKE